MRDRSLTYRWVAPAAFAALTLVLPVGEAGAAAAVLGSDESAAVVERAEGLVRVVAEAARRLCGVGGAKWVVEGSGWAGRAAAGEIDHSGGCEVLVLGRDVRGVGGAWSGQVMGLPSKLSLPPPVV